MKIYQPLIEFVGRFAVGIAMLVALFCAAVIVMNVSATNPPVGSRVADRVVGAAPVEPAPVPISFGRFEAG